MMLNKKIATFISMIVIFIVLIFLLVIYQKLNENRYKACINNNGKAVVNEYGFFKNCIYE
jgi:preprotein translocase subunit YajC